MDKAALAARNRLLTKAFHQESLKHRVRRNLAAQVARLPIASLDTRVSRVLFVRPDHLGDVLLAAPAMRAVKAAYPNTEIHALVGPWSAPVLANYPEIDAVLTLPFPGFERGETQKKAYAPYLDMIRVSRQLRHVGYSSAVIMRPDHWWGAMAVFLAGIRRRIGYDMPGVTPFLTHALPHRHHHAIVQNMHLVERWTGPLDRSRIPFSFPVHDEDRAAVDEMLKERQISPDQPIIAIHPGAGAWAKLWDEAKWAQVADILSEQLNVAVVFTGSGGEQAMIDTIISQMTKPAVALCGETDINQLAALYQRARVAIGPDSGPLHLAAAVGTPTVALFGPADPIEFAPWGDHRQHIVLTSEIECRPCRVLDWHDDDPANHPCVREIKISQVLEAARSAAQYEGPNPG